MFDCTFDPDRPGFNSDQRDHGRGENFNQDHHRGGPPPPFHNQGVKATTAAGNRVKGPGSTEVTKAAPIKSRTMREVVGSVRVGTTQTSHKGVGVNRIKGSPAIDRTRLTTGLATNAKKTLPYPAQPNI